VAWGKLAGKNPRRNSITDTKPSPCQAKTHAGMPATSIQLREGIR
jgi:hypothetical protein